MKLQRFFITPIAALAVLLTACQTDDITLDLNITGMPDGTRLAISVGCTHSEEDTITTATILDGHAHMQWQADDEPLMYDIRVPESYGRIAFVAQKGNHITITAQATDSQRGDMTYWAFTDVKVEGSPMHDLYLERNVDRDTLNAMYDAYQTEYADVGQALSAAQTAAQRDSIFATERGQDLEKAEKEFFDFVEKTYTDAFLANKDSWLGPLLMLDNMNTIDESMADIFDQMSDQAKESFYGRIVRDMVYPPSLVGEVMPDFTFTDHATGQPLSLKAVLDANSYVLLDFWASWCGPCRREIPNLKKQYELHHSQGFEIISISADDSQDDWLKALDEEKLPWPNDIDGNQGIQKLYDVQYYPTLYLLDHDGRVVAKDIRGQELADTLAARLPSE